jgi:hypothetical protein
MRSEPESYSQPNNYSFHHKTKKLQKNIQVRQKQTKKQRIMDVVSGTLLPTYITISVENMTKNRNVSENKESQKTRGTMKKVSYADVVKKGSSNDMKIMKRNG